MNEWELQRRLTTRWVRDGVSIGGRKHMLVAWEVMLKSWKLNDPSVYWTEPSADFLVADADWNLTVIEVKNRMTGYKPILASLFQVTYSAYLLGASVSADRLEQAYRNSWHVGYADPGDQRDLTACEKFNGLAEHYACFFDTNNSIPDQPNKQIGRCLGAVEFGASWGETLTEFNSASSATIDRLLRSELTAKAYKRVIARMDKMPIGAFDRMKNVEELELIMS